MDFRKTHSCGATLAIAIALAFVLTACHRAPEPEPDVSTIQKEAAAFLSQGEFEKAEIDFRWLSSKRPKDNRFKANLAFALTEQGKDAEAVKIYDQLIGEGEGTYDLFAYYARSLEGVGRDDDAIIWNYRALMIVPSLVDVRGNLAKQLTRKGRPYEALGLLASFDSQLEQRGTNPYFAGQRIAIAAKLAPASEQSGAAIQATKIEDVYYTIVFGKDGETEPFLIDTGASHTTMSTETLERLGIPVASPSKRVTMNMADGTQALGRQSTLPSLQIGPYLLKDVVVVQCDGCQSLLGQSTLSRFDLATTKANGLEILTMKLRSQ